MGVIVNTIKPINKQYLIDPIATLGIPDNNINGKLECL